MPLITSKELLEKAREEKYAVAMFDVCNYEMIRGITEAAEEMASPVILGALKPDLEGRGLDYYAAMVRVAVEKAGIPVAVHLDHASDFEECRRAIDAGFNSVMIDGSALPFEENAALVKEICGYAHRYGVSVEAELGHVPDAIAGTGEAAEMGDGHKNPKDHLTQPGDVVRFVNETGVDALAIAIGTAHGSYYSAPELEIGLLKEINAVSPAALVLHGGSGTPEEQLKAAIENGITKINVFTDILIAYYSTLRQGLNESNNMGKWPAYVNAKPVAAMKEAAKEKIRLFGSAGRGVVSG